MLIFASTKCLINPQKIPLGTSKCQFFAVTFEVAIFLCPRDVPKPRHVVSMWKMHIALVRASEYINLHLAPHTHIHTEWVPAELQLCGNRRGVRPGALLALGCENHERTSAQEGTRRSEATLHGCSEAAARRCDWLQAPALIRVRQRRRLFALSAFFIWGPWNAIAAGKLVSGANWSHCKVWA
jgi:hypothetical protein